MRPRRIPQVDVDVEVQEPASRRTTQTGVNVEIQEPASRRTTQTGVNVEIQEPRKRQLSTLMVMLELGPMGQGKKTKDKGGSGGGGQKKVGPGGADLMNVNNSITIFKPGCTIAS